MHTVPENTVEAFTWAMKNGADMLEMDVHPAATGEIMVIHDGMVDRTSNGTGEVRCMTLKELKNLDFGHSLPVYRGRGVKIPTLDEVLEAFPGVLCSIDIKSCPEFADA